MYAAVETEKCISCGICLRHAPHVFSYNANQQAYNALDDNLGIVKIPSLFLKEVQEAEEKCPDALIHLSARPLSAEKKKEKNQDSSS